MQTMTRKDAILNNLSQYFTGQPCKNGHVTYRYTKSGSCSQCISDSHNAKTGTPAVQRMTQRKMQNDELRAQYDAKQLALNNLVQINVIIHEPHFRIVIDVIKGYCISRYPALTEDDIPNPMRTRLDPVIFSVRVPYDDVMEIRKFTDQLDRTVPRFYHDIDQRKRIVCSTLDAGGSLDDAFKKINK